MRTLDRWLQRWRAAKALPFIREGDRLLDIGCYDRVLMERAAGRVASALGVDPLIEAGQRGRLRWQRGTFPQEVDFEAGAFDCITMLAVLEHVPRPSELAAACERVLAPGGRVVLTVPHPFVDTLLDVLIRSGLADGMSEEEHHGFDVRSTGSLFEAAGLRLVSVRSFQLGLNRLFVFEKD